VNGTPTKLVKFVFYSAPKIKGVYDGNFPGVKCVTMATCNSFFEALVKSTKSAQGKNGPTEFNYVVLSHERALKQLRSGVFLSTVS
jgi:hypothetical protein